MRSVDFYLVYWGSPLIAHTMLSFGFEGGDYVCFSIETRKEKGEEYSALKGILLNGKIDAMAYERKTLYQGLPFSELKTRSLINDRAKAADNSAAFSSVIREGLPGF